MQRPGRGTPYGNDAGKCACDCGLGRYVAGFCRRFVSSLMIGRIVPWVDPQLTQPRSHA
ncbi:hypothetical protein BN13_270012 [Nostocoides jenkinsii Ben 74]|uniref:Uncharacterized protein n=1 Tax=Nostocoides jenkinsii Ben 74 TaxID=1193518 RepID=A0A077MDM4_9MICO|nr:hypothetical protein BN13_270012 [Tetrasphaera jenkinsii Ben 74]